MTTVQQQIIEQKFISARKIYNIQRLQRVAVPGNNSELLQKRLLSTIKLSQSNNHATVLHVTRTITIKMYNAESGKKTTWPLTQASAQLAVG